MDEQHKDAQPRAGGQEEASRKAMRENVMRVALTSEARQRLANVRMVKPEVAHAIEEYIIQLVTSGRLKRTIDDDQLKELLTTIQGTPKREFKIRRI
jgi:programmed cell death protein 5